jgi:hypothetical protein
MVCKHDSTAKNSFSALTEMYPTPADIRRRAAEVRSQWTPAERERRRTMARRAGVVWQVLATDTQLCGE